MIKRFVFESFQALFEEWDYITAFYLFGGTILGVTGALLQARGAPTNGIVAVVVTLIIPIHFAVFGVYRRCYRQAPSDTIVVTNLLDGIDAEGDQKSFDLLVWGAVACVVGLLLFCSVPQAFNGFGGHSAALTREIEAQRTGPLGRIERSDTPVTPTQEAIPRVGEAQPVSQALAHSQSTVTNISTPAYELINNRVAADQQTFYVYLDQDSGLNHGFPSGFMGTDQTTITLNAGCIDSSSSSSGCSTDPTVLDPVHGTVMSVSFAAQPPGNWAGLALEEPQAWLALQYGNGYNLTGATTISFDVRSPNGAQVQYGVGGCVTPFTSPISAQWTNVTLSLSNSTLSCNPTLTNVNLLFEVVTNDVHDPQGATVLLDNIQFNPVPTLQSAALSFPLANETFGVLPQQGPPIPSDQVLRNTTTIYESALAEYVLLARGAPQDLQNAKLIADAFDYALHHESHGDPIPAAAGGYTGLHNGYESGDIGLYNNQPAPLLGQAGDIRLAGFTDTSLCSPSGYCLVLDGATGGNNAFAIIGLVDAYKQFGNVNYLNDALTIGSWIVGNLTDTTGTGYGGYYVGYGDEGIPPPKPLETGKSIENNADIFAAFTALANIQSQLGNRNAAASWMAAANVAGDFVMQMYDPIHGRFNVGTSPVGTLPSPGACPTGAVKGNDVINVCDFLDSNTFTTLAMAGAPRYRNQIDWRLPIQYVLNTFAQNVTAAEQTYAGFDIVPIPDSGANGVGWEFTGQTVEAMNYVDKLYNVNTFQSQAIFYLNQIAGAQTSAPFGDGLGLVASTLQGGDTLTPVNQCLSTPYQCIAERVGLAATIWGILAEKGLNPYLLVSAGAAACDVRNQGNVNIVDVQYAVNEALGSVAAANDLNGDGVVNVIDVQIVINAALGLGCS